jgi:hypothetical protein
MSQTNRTLNRSFLPYPTRTAAFLLAISVVGSAFAIDQPPQDPEQQRPWLVGHLVTDMKTLGTFSSADFGKVADIVNNMTDDQVELLAQYYYLTRAKTLQDSSLYAMQQQGCSDEEVNTAKAEIADLLTYQQQQIDACYSQLQPMGVPIQYAAQVVYSSVPGWCAYSQCCVPDWYYDNGCYLGCAFNRGYCGDYAEPVFNAWHDNGSYFNSLYNKTAFIAKSINKAHRQANWYHNHDWHRSLSHDRLTQASYHANHQGVHVGKTLQRGHGGNGHNGLRLSSPRNTARPGKHATNLTNTGKLSSRTSQATPTPRPTRQASRPSLAHAKPASRRASQVHAQRSKPAAHSQHPRATAHASHPKPAAHASPPRPAPHAQAHAAHSNPQKRR